MDGWTGQGLDVSAILKFFFVVTDKRVSTTSGRQYGIHLSSSRGRSFLIRYLVVVVVVVVDRTGLYEVDREWAAQP